MNLSDLWTVRLTVVILGLIALEGLTAVCYLALVGRGVDAKDILAVVAVVVGVLSPSPLSKAKVGDEAVAVTNPPGEALQVDPQ